MRILSESRIVITPRMMRERTFRTPPERPRSPGVHVQSVNRALGIAAGRLSDSDDDSFPFERMTDEVYPLMMALGVGWEELRASMYPEERLIWQPGELERDGIYGTPDGLILNQQPLVGGCYDVGWDPYEPEDWECKQTTKKVQSIKECWLYLKQGLSYYAMGGPRRTRYEICWVLGDYSKPYQPIATSTLVEFTEQEREAWWKIVVEAAKKVKPE